MARVTRMSRVTGRVIRRATASPVSRASSAASPAAPAIARSSAISRASSAPPRPEPVNRTTAVPTRSPCTTIGLLSWAPWACAGNPGDLATARPDRSRIRASAPVRATRSSAGDRSAKRQPWLRSQAEPAATAIASVSCARCRLARLDTSAAAKAAVSPASRATAASATREEGQRQAQADRVTAGRGAGRPVSHRGRGRAGNRRPARSARSAGRPGPPRSCGAGSSRASRRCARTPRTHTRAPG